MSKSHRFEFACWAVNRLAKRLRRAKAQIGKPRLTPNHSVAKRANYAALAASARPGGRTRASISFLRSYPMGNPF
jgi:hypothetical protein